MDDELEPVDPGLEQLINDVINTATGPIDWSRLHARHHAQQLEILDDWVRWLVRQYGIDQREIPDCWSQHPELVEELAALRTARTAAYGPDAFPTAALDWHHAFSLTRDRLRQMGRASLDADGANIALARPTVLNKNDGTPDPLDSRLLDACRRVRSSARVGRGAGGSLANRLPSGLEAVAREWHATLPGAAGGEWLERGMPRSK